MPQKEKIGRDGVSIQVVALDLDGTLLDHNARLPAVNAAAIMRAQAQGVGVIVATGKTREAAVPIMEQLNITLPGVFFQGHLISEANGRILRRLALEQQDIVEVLEYARSRDLRVIVYDQDGLWSPTPGAHCSLIHEKYHEPLPRIMSLEESVGNNKVLIVWKGDKEALRSDLEQRFGDHLRVIPTVPEYIELMSPHVSKGEGVAWLLNELGIDPQNMLAVGDGENDVEMLQLAGIGVAVANAVPAAKAAADFVVAANDQGGVAEALERFVTINR